LRTTAEILISVSSLYEVRPLTPLDGYDILAPLVWHVTARTCYKFALRSGDEARSTRLRGMGADLARACKILVWTLTDAHCWAHTSFAGEENHVLVGHVAATRVSRPFRLNGLTGTTGIWQLDRSSSLANGNDRIGRIDPFHHSIHV